MRGYLGLGVPVRSGRGPDRALRMHLSGIIMLTWRVRPCFTRSEACQAVSRRRRGRLALVYTRTFECTSPVLLHAQPFNSSSWTCHVDVSWTWLTLAYRRDTRCPFTLSVKPTEPLTKCGILSYGPPLETRLQHNFIINDAPSSTTSLYQLLWGSLRELSEPTGCANDLV